MRCRVAFAGAFPPNYDFLLKTHKKMVMLMLYSTLNNVCQNMTFYRFKSERKIMLENTIIF